MFDLTHLNENGDAHMVDISGKASTERTAIASGVINMSLKAIGILADNTAEKATYWARPASPPSRPPSRPAF